MSQSIIVVNIDNLFIELVICPCIIDWFVLSDYVTYFFMSINMYRLLIQNLQVATKIERSCKFFYDSWDWYDNFLFDSRIFQKLMWLTSLTSCGKRAKGSFISGDSKSFSCFRKSWRCVRKGIIRIIWCFYSVCPNKWNVWHDI